MIKDHKFKPAPFYPDRCDVRIDTSGTSRTQCGMKGSEHESCHAPEGVHAPVRHQEGPHVFMRCEDCLLFLGDIESPAVQEVRDLETKAAVQTRNDLKECAHRVAIRNALKVLDRQAGGCLHDTRRILQKALDVVAESH